MAKNINISSATSTILIAKGSSGGAVKKITIANNSANAATVSVGLDPVTSGLFYFIQNVIIPSGATLVLNDNLAFNSEKYHLRISNAGTSPDITVIIK